MIKLILAVAFTVFLTAGPAIAGFEEGLKAYKSGNYEKALKEFKADATGKSCFNIGVMYLKGEGVQRDPGEAGKWMKKGAEQGDRNAQFFLGTMYDKGEVYAKDLSVAAQWYRKAGEQGHPQAQFNLGLMLTNGEGVEKNRDEAVKWLRKAASAGHVNAQKLLKVMGEK